MDAKRSRVSIPCLVLLAVLSVAVASHAQIATGANKYLGNITTNGLVRSDFMTYWNQITPENAAKWGSVEATQGVFHWNGVDSVEKFADSNHIPWKFHNLVWGSQQPSWISGLSQSAQLAAVNAWMDSAHAKYPNVNMIDVVNEGYPSHHPPPYAAALGGTGATGYDWIMTAFNMARQRWPKAILIYNDYNICEYSAENTWVVAMVDSFKKHNAPLDAIGCQGHDIWTVSATTVQTYLNKIAATGIPIAITEFDIPETSDSTELSIMESRFPMLWNDSAVFGVTYWGYLVGATWKTGTGLINTNGTLRPALTWLINYVTSNLNPPNEYPGLVAGGHVGVKSQYKSIHSSSGARDGPGHMEILDLQGRKIVSLPRTTPVSSIMMSKGNYIIKRDGQCEGVFTKVR